MRQLKKKTKRKNIRNAYRRIFAVDYFSSFIIVIVVSLSNRKKKENNIEQQQFFFSSSHCDHEFYFYFCFKFFRSFDFLFRLISNRLEATKETWIFFDYYFFFPLIFVNNFNWIWRNWHIFFSEVVCSAHLGKSKKKKTIFWIFESRKMCIETYIFNQNRSEERKKKLDFFFLFISFWVWTKIRRKI